MIAERRLCSRHRLRRVLWTWHARAADTTALKATFAEACGAVASKRLRRHLLAWRAHAASQAALDAHWAARAMRRGLAKLAAAACVAARLILARPRHALARFPRLSGAAFAAGSGRPRHPQAAANPPRPFLHPGTLARLAARLPEPAPATGLTRAASARLAALRLKSALAQWARLKRDRCRLVAAAGQVFRKRRAAGCRRTLQRWTVALLREVSAGQSSRCGNATAIVIDNTLVGDRVRCPLRRPYRVRGGRSRLLVTWPGWRWWRPSSRPSRAVGRDWTSGGGSWRRTTPTRSGDGRGARLLALGVLQVSDMARACAVCAWCQDGGGARRARLRGGRGGALRGGGACAAGP